MNDCVNLRDAKRTVRFNAALGAVLPGQTTLVYFLRQVSFEHGEYLLKRIMIQLESHLERVKIHALARYAWSNFDACPQCI